MTADRTTKAALPPANGASSLGRNARWGEVYVSGQIGNDPVSGTLRQGGIAPQTEQAIDNVAAVLASFGCSLRDVLKVTVFLADIDDFDAMDEVYSKRFSQPFPARTTIQARIPEGARIQIETIAHSRQWDEVVD